MTTPIDPNEAAKALAEEISDAIIEHRVPDDAILALILKHFQKFKEGTPKRR